MSVATDSAYTPTASRWKSEFTYDGRGRMRVRKDYTWYLTDWLLQGETRYVYDPASGAGGMRVVQERDSSNRPLVSYGRGNDLSGSLEGAGGIGGLLSRSEHSLTSPYAITRNDFYYADGSGNIVGMVYTIQEALAEYRYDPFGRPRLMSRTKAAANVYRFSKGKGSLLTMFSPV